LKFKIMELTENKFLEIVKQIPEMLVIEKLEPEIYQFVVAYKGNIIFQNSLFRSSGSCNRYINHREKGINSLKIELEKLGIIPKVN